MQKKTQNEDEKPVKDRECIKCVHVLEETCMKPPGISCVRFEDRANEE